MKEDDLMKIDMNYYAERFRTLGFYDENMVISDVIKELESLVERLKKNGVYEADRDILSIMSELEDLAVEEKYSGAYDKNKENIIMQNSLYREGKEEGRREGKMQEKKDIAKNLLHIGISIDKISDATGLTKEQIEELK